MAYIGTQPNNVKKNIGLYSPSEILQLTKDGNWGGSLELITESNITSATASVDFTNLANTPYDIYLITVDNFQGASDGTGLYVRLSNDNGTSFIASNYHYCRQRNYFNSSGTGFTQEGRSTSTSFIAHIGAVGNATDEKGNSRCYIYNLLSTSSTLASYSSTNMSSSGDLDGWFGNGGYSTGEVHNAIQVVGTDNITNANIKLFGVKEI